MSTNLIWSLTSVLRSEGLPDRRQGLFLLQLLAWDKLDRQGQLAPDLSLLHTAAHFEVRQYIQRAFHYLEREAAVNAPAFELKPHIFRSLSESNLRSLLHIIIGARSLQPDY